MATMTTTTPESARQRDEAPQQAPRTVPPRVDIYETEKLYVLLADMPGVGPDGVEAVAEPGELTIEGRVTPPERLPDYQEFELASYRRVFTLTEDLDTDAIAATMRDGVLRVEIPKSPRVQPRKIPVRTA